MHSGKPELEIGVQSSRISSQLPTSHSPSTHQNHLPGSNQDPPEKPDHLRICIPPTIQPSFEDGDVCSSPLSVQKTLLSTPHKRPIMVTQSPSSSYQPSTVQKHSPFVNSNLKPASFTSNPRKVSSFSCLNAFPIPFRTKKLQPLDVCQHLSRVHFLGIHLRCFFLLLLPLLYFLASNPHRSLFLELVSIVGFSLALLISLNLALPRFPSIRLLLSRSLPTKITSFSASKPCKPVVWSIGSKPKIEKKPACNSGCWVEVYSNGDVYEGEFHDGKCSGSGVYYYNKSGRYEGDWVDGKYDGYGVETWARGSRYRGRYRQGLRHGVGVYRFYTGDVYGGEWCNGQCHGIGEHTCDDGSKYVGEFKQGVKHGLGRYHFRNGDTYSGEYFADKMHGFGVYHFGNGHRYEGAWHEGRRQGFGMYSFRNGETQCGHWRNGVLDTPSTQGVGAGLPCSVIHSKVLNAVQEARRTAERAQNMGKVDERVNKAIAAANRSANAARVAAVKAVQNQMNPRQNQTGINGLASISRS